MKLSEVIQELRDDFNGDEVTVGEVVEHFEARGFGTIMLVPALVTLLPTGWIVGVPAICGLLIFLLALQKVFGRSHPWLPNKLAAISISNETLKKSADKILPMSYRMDRHLKPRLQWLTNQFAERLVALGCGLLGLSFIPLELIPGACAIPAIAVIFASIGLVTKDGLITIMGAGFLIATAYLLFGLFS